MREDILVNLLLSVMPASSCCRISKSLTYAYMQSVFCVLFHTMLVLNYGSNAVAVASESPEMMFTPTSGLLGVQMTPGLNNSAPATNSNSTGHSAMDPHNKSDFYIGLGLALSSTVFIGSSFIVKKKGLLRVARSSGGRAGSGGFAYLKEWLWWIGLITMIVGEVANFSAYAFAPAVLVTPLGALSVIVSAFLASILLKERLNLHGKVGSLLCLLGSTVIVINAPDEQQLDTMEEIKTRISNAAFLTYAVIAIVVSVVLIFYYAPRYGKTNLLVYTAICSLIGSLSVTFCKGLGVAIKQTFRGDSQVGNWLTWLFVLGVASCVITQMNYLNKALDIFNTSMVTPIYYVMFTTFTIIASAIFFKEWQDLDTKEVLGVICGFGTIVTGVFLIHAFKDLKFSISDLPLFHKDSQQKWLEAMGDLKMSRLVANDVIDRLEQRNHQQESSEFGDEVSLDSDEDGATDEMSKLQPNGNALRS